MCGSVWACKMRFFHKFSDLPALPDSLRGPLSDLLTTAATLERGYQSVISGNWPSGNPLGELNDLYGQWLADRDRFLGAVKGSEQYWNQKAR